MRKILSLWMLVLLAVACQKEDVETIVAPEILDFSVSADTTVKVGSTIDFWVKTRPGSVGEQEISWTLEKTAVANTESTPISFGKTGVYTVTCQVQNSEGKVSRSVKVTVKNFVGGFYLVNEGQFGVSMGSLNHFDPTSQQLTTLVYSTLNDEKTFGKSTCFGKEFNGNFYFVSKQGNRLVQADALSLKHQATLLELGGDGRSFAGIDANRGVVTTSDGAYLVNLTPLSLGRKLTDDTDTECGGVYATEKYLFVISKKNGIKVYDIAKDFELAKEYGKGSVGFTMDKNGYLWAAAESELLKIDVNNLEMTEVTLPAGVAIYASWGGWNPGSLCASPIENAIFFTKAQSWGSGGREIYKYKIGDTGSLTDTFIKSSVADDNFYGSGISIDPKSGDIVATFVKDGWNESYKDNRLVIYDSKTGQEKSRYLFEGFYFPGMILFN